MISTKNISQFVESKKGYLLLLGIILFVALFSRLWKIDQYLPFLGDEGRDVRIVRRFLTDFDLMFIGPRTSIGNIYLGPLFYYLIAPFLALWNFSPVGPAVFVALLDFATVFLVAVVSKNLFGPVAGLTSSALYATSPLIVEHAKHSWNPNIMPFFALVSVYSIWMVWQKGKSLWLLILGVSLAFVVQSHYLGLLLFPLTFLFWLAALFLGVTKEQKSRFFLHTLASMGIFALLMSPLLLFDIKHGWQNFDSLKTFFIERQSTVSARPWNALPELWPLWREYLVSRLVFSSSAFFAKGVGLTVLLGVAWYLVKTGVSRRWANLMFVILWIGIGLLGLGLYKQEIYDHYFGFLFPAPFILLGAIFEKFWSSPLKVLVIGVSILILWLNFENSPLRKPPQRQLERVGAINKSIIENSDNKPFNFGLIAKRNYEEGYLYYFELWGAKVKEIDAQNTDETITDQLFVVCEDPICEVINNPKAEIANFGWSKIEREWEVKGIKIFKLTHAQ